MNYYGLFMALGWIYIFKSLDPVPYNLNTEYLALFFGLITILGSKIFQKIFRDTWTGNASHGAFFGGYIGLCLLNKICQPIVLLNKVSYNLPVLFFLIRLGNYFNGEHFKNNNYISLIEGILQGPIAFLLINFIKYENPIIIFIVFVSFIRIIFEFFRNNFDIKNILFCLITIVASLYLPFIINFNGLFVALFLLDRVCRTYLHKRYIVKNYGFNLSFLSEYRQLNKYIHIAFIIILFRHSNFKEHPNYNLITLGIINNFIDRINYGYIIDYIPFFWYRCNIADIMIIVGLICNYFLIVF
jgi:lipoprotein signal peptidase